MFDFLERVTKVICATVLLFTAIIGGATIVCVFGIIEFLISVVDFFVKEWRRFRYGKT